MRGGGRNLGSEVPGMKEVEVSASLSKPSGGGMSGGGGRKTGPVIFPN